jgi:hypothetical protein
MNSSTQLDLSKSSELENLFYFNRSTNRFKNRFVIGSSSTIKSDSIWSISNSATTTQTSESSGKLQKSLSKTSTELVETSNEVYLEIEAIFWSAKEEFFEDGMESEFSKKLYDIVIKYGK